MRRQRWAIRLPRRRARSRRGGTLGDLGLRLCHSLLDLLERELQLIGIEPLRAAPEAGALQLAKQVTQPIELLVRTIALRHRGIARDHQGIALGNKHRMLGQPAARQVAQRFDVVGKVCWIAHAQSKI